MNANPAALQRERRRATPSEEAKRVYERILREKAGKGCQIVQATANGDAAISD
jgi:hypothetical protein